MGFFRSRFISAEHRCKKVSTDPLVMEMTLRSDDYVQLAGFTGTATTNCVSEPVTVEGTTWQQLVIRTDANRAQIIPDPATTDCRTSADAVVVSHVRSYEVARLVTNLGDFRLLATTCTKDKSLGFIYDLPLMLFGKMHSMISCAHVTQLMNL